MAVGAGSPAPRVPPTPWSAQQNEKSVSPKKNCCMLAKVKFKFEVSFAKSS